MSSAHDARTAVDRAAEKIILEAIHGTEVQSEPHTQLDIAGRSGRCKRKLKSQRSFERVTGIDKRRENSVTGSLDDHSSIGFNRCARKGVVLRQGRAHPIRLVLPQSSAALDVGEQERACGGLILHSGACPTASRLATLASPLIFLLV